MPKKEKRTGIPRRKSDERRSRTDRRNSNDMVWKGLEKRTGKDRRETEEKRNVEDRRFYPKIPKLMKMRTVYIKVSDMDQAKKFYSEFLEMEPVKEGNVWCEFKLNNINFGLRLNDFGDKWEGANFVPVFEFMESEVFKYITLAKKLGATLVVDALEDTQMLSVVMRDPFGNEFEISKFHE